MPRCKQFFSAKTIFIEFRMICKFSLHRCIQSSCFLVKLNNRQAKKPRAQLCLVEAARFIFQGNLVRRKCMWRTIVRLTPSSTSALQNNISMIHTWLKLCPTRKHLLMIFFIPVSNLEKTIKNKKCQKLTARIGETLCSVQTN